MLEEKVAELPVEVKQELPDTVKITAEEGLELRNIELSYLKAQIESERLQRMIQDLSKKYPAAVNVLTKKYSIDEAAYIFDAVALQFKKR